MTLPPRMAAYLRRLGVEDPGPPGIEALRRLHRAHLEAIPFENADVLRGSPIRLDEDELVDRLAAGRGGFCYQLNGAFAALLAALGYAVERLPARFHGGSGMEPPFGHLAIRATLDGAPWLVDVGAGYSFTEPLRLEPGLEQDDPTGTFRIVEGEPAPDDGPRVLDVAWRDRDGTFRPHFRFEPVAHGLDAFEASCEWTRTSPDSPFTRSWICAHRLPDGWATLDDRHLIVTTGATRIEDDLVDDAALAEALERWFGVEREASEAAANAPATPRR